MFYPYKSCQEGYGRGDHVPVLGRGRGAGGRGQGHAPALEPTRRLQALGGEGKGQHLIISLLAPTLSP